MRPAGKIYLNYPRGAHAFAFHSSQIFSKSSGIGFFGLPNCTPLCFAASIPSRCSFFTIFRYFGPVKIFSGLFIHINVFLRDPFPVHGQELPVLILLPGTDAYVSVSPSHSSSSSRLPHLFPGSKPAKIEKIPLAFFCYSVIMPISQYAKALTRRSKLDLPLSREHPFGGRMQAAPV